jgi:ribonucleoside-diphosphate reductase alpha chain
VPDDVKKVFKVSHEISVEAHVRMQAAFQKHTGNAVSKTINLPNSATKEDVKQTYLLAHKLKCKGTTVYRDGSREMQVLNIGSVNKEIVEQNAQQKIENLEETRKIKPKQRPEITTGFTEKVKTACGNLYITVNFDDVDELCEVLTNTGRDGGCPAQSEATSRLVSIALRAGVDAKVIAQQLKGIRCPSVMKRGGSLKALSCPDAIGRLIENVLSKKLSMITEEISEDIEEMMIEETGNICSGSCAECSIQCKNSNSKSGKCPECKADMLIHESGCVTCKNCGWSFCL